MMQVKYPFGPSTLGTFPPPAKPAGDDPAGGLEVEHTVDGLTDGHFKSDTGAPLKRI